MVSCFFFSLSSHTIHPPYLNLCNGKARVLFCQPKMTLLIMFFQSHRLLFVITTALSALAFGRRGSATAPAPATTTV